MTDKDYLKQMIALTEELELSHSASPYDPDVSNKIMARVNALHMCKFYSRRRRPLFAFVCCIILLIILCLIMYEILELLWIRGT